MRITSDSCQRWWLESWHGNYPDSQRIGWPIARDLALRGHIKRAELRGTLGKRLLAECERAGIRVVVERESMGIKWVRFEHGEKA